jgi:RNA polymerase subunit RPABC4/transcription elongation factor Spt4
MSYIFNRINLIVVVVMIFLITMSMNEVAHFAKRLDLSNKAAYAQWFTSHKTVFSTQEDCQKNTGALCNYEECDYIPDGQTLSEVCGKNFTKGWRPTIVTIPEAYRDIASLQLSIGPAASRQIIEIKPNDLTIQYSSLGSSDSSVKTKPIKSHDLTLLVNNMISYEFLRIAEVRVHPIRSY